MLLNSHPCMIIVKVRIRTRVHKYRGLKWGYLWRKWTRKEARIPYNGRGKYGRQWRQGWGRCGEYVVILQYNEGARGCVTRMWKGEGEVAVCGGRKRKKKKGRRGGTDEVWKRFYQGKLGQDETESTWSIIRVKRMIKKGKKKSTED